MGSGDALVCTVNRLSNDQTDQRRWVHAVLYSAERVQGKALNLFMKHILGFFDSAGPSISPDVFWAFPSSE